MPELLKKSEENILAASLLIENELYASSVHCSYYSCFQKLKNVISQAYGSDYEELENERYSLIKLLRLRSKRTLGTHEFYIDRKLVDLIRRENKDHRLINQINDLKLRRTISDYDNKEIIHSEAIKVFSKTKEVLKTLNTLL